MVLLLLLPVAAASTADRHGQLMLVGMCISASVLCLECFTNGQGYVYVATLLVHCLLRVGWIDTVLWAGAAVAGLHQGVAMVQAAAAQMGSIASAALAATPWHGLCSVAALAWCLLLVSTWHACCHTSQWRAGELENVLHAAAELALLCCLPARKLLRLSCAAVSGCGLHSCD